MYHNNFKYDLPSFSLGQNTFHKETKINNNILLRKPSPMFEKNIQLLFIVKLHLCWAIRISNTLTLAL